MMPRLHVRQTWPRVSFHRSQSWRDLWKDVILYHWWDQNGITEGVENNYEKWVPKVLQRLEKPLAQAYYIWGWLLRRGQYRFLRINNLFNYLKFSLLFNIPRTFFNVSSCILLHISASKTFYIFEENTAYAVKRL
jgi:hypothetical protein